MLIYLGSWHNVLDDNALKLKQYQMVVRLNQRDKQKEFLIY